MSADLKLKWLKYILLAKAVFCFLIWGLPCLLAPLSLIQRLGVPVPADPLFMRLAGGFIVSFGVAYWYAYRDPLHNQAIVKVGVVDNGLATLVILAFFIFYGLDSIFMGVSVLLTFLFFLAFLFLMPRAQIT